jgi:hypothetical protein
MVISALLALLSVGAVLDADEDETWLVTIICALLASPLGWIYYLPLLTAPLIIVATEHRLPRRTWFAWPLLAVPPVSLDWFQAHTITALSVGSVYTWGLLWIWVCAVQAAVASGRGASERTRCGDSAARKSAVGSFPAMM